MSELKLRDSKMKEKPQSGNKAKLERKASKRLVCLLTGAALVMAGAIPAFGADRGAVQVTLPSFNVTMNGIHVNNDYSKYPLIVYKDITYFPMTYSDCRFLGIESTWKGNKEGLIIEKTGVTAAYGPYKTTGKNGRSYGATIPKFPIKVNGKIVENSKEEYPLLSFRDITYFPMTWKYGVEAFGWNYNFDKSKGLIIESTNTMLWQTAISPSRPNEDEYSKYKGNPSTTVTVTDKYVYYEGVKGQIMQAPLSDTSKAKAVYQLDKWSYGDGKTYNPHRLYSENGKAFIYIHSGGAVMGNETVMLLKDDGSTEIFNDNRTQKKIFDDKTFEWWIGPAPSPGNLTLRTGKGEAVPIGDPGLLYGWLWDEKGDSRGGGSCDRAYLIGNDIYILGFDMSAKKHAEETTGIYKVNIVTNETTRIGDYSIVDFVIEGDYIYGTDGAFIYKTQISTGKQEDLGPFIMAPYGSVAGIEVLCGNIYYMLEETRESQSSPPYDQPLYSIIRLYPDNVKGERFQAPDNNNLISEAGMGIMGTTDKYMVCTFEEKESTKYRIIVFDKNGKEVFKTSDKAYMRNINIVGNTIYFYNITTGTVCRGELK